jgi:hypothetical protein
VVQRRRRTFPHAGKTHILLALVSDYHTASKQIPSVSKQTQRKKSGDFQHVCVERGARQTLHEMLSRSGKAHTPNRVKSQRGCCDSRQNKFATRTEDADSSSALMKSLSLENRVANIFIYIHRTTRRVSLKRRRLQEC